MKFDVSPRLARNEEYTPAPSNGVGDIKNKEEEVTFHPEVSVKVKPSRSWEMDVKGMVSTSKWLATFGLKRNRLDMVHLLPQIGFKHCDGELTGS